MKTPPSAEELTRAKGAILNSFIFNFDTPEKVLREKMAYEFYHYPLDFLELYRTNIEKVTSDDVARVARKYVHKEEMPVLVVGNSSEMGEQKLSLLGKVTPVDISIPTAVTHRRAPPTPPHKPLRPQAIPKAKRSPQSLYRLSAGKTKSRPSKPSSKSPPACATHRRAK